MATTITDKIALLQAWLREDPKAHKWVALKLGEDDVAKEIENIRGELTNKVLKPMSKDAVSANDLSMLSALASATVVFDAANALFYMKLARDDPECPRGFAWIREGDLAQITAPKWKETTQTHSVAKAYGIVAAWAEAAGDLTTAKFLHDATMPVFPGWMVRTGQAPANATLP